MKISANENLVQTWRDQIRSALVASGGRYNSVKWIEENTADPRDPLKKWSFSGHEWQKGLLSCDKNDISIEKAAQTGCSEVALRMALGLVVVQSAATLIYVLPSAGFNRKFVGSRVDPVIDNSRTLRGLINRNIDNLELKQIGNSFIHFAGASKTTQAISTPATIILVDEFNFCDFEVVSSFASRLEHCRPGEDLRVYFSTPTLPGFGISERYSKGDQRVYMVRHDKCGRWVEVTPWQDIVVPGYDGTLATFTKRDLTLLNDDVDRAWVRCQVCGEEISHANLAEPEKRQWVEKVPSARKASFRVTPLDCPEINPVEKIVRKVEQYSLHKDFLNYGLGLAAQDSESMVLPEAMERARKEVPVGPLEGASGCVMGVDVGVVSHIVIGKPVGNSLKILWLERVRQDGENTLQLVVEERMKQYGVLRVVVDAQPDISVPRALVANAWMGQVLAAYFVTGAGPRTLDLCSVDVEEGVIKIARTRAFDEMVREINSNGVGLLKEHYELDLFLQHLGRLRKVTGEGIDGQDRSRWISTSDEDHYALAMLYMFIAAKSLEEQNLFVMPPEVLSGKMINRIRLQTVK